jgi:hypothetical protein
MRRIRPMAFVCAGAFALASCGGGGSPTSPSTPPGATSAPVAMGVSGAKTYHCTIHPGMVGGFNGAEAEVPPGCNQAYCFGGG